MQIYFSRCKKHNDNACPKKLVMLTNKKFKGKSRCADCMAIGLFFDEINDKYELETTVSQFLID